MKHTPEPWSYEPGKGKHEGTIVITSYTMSAHSPLAHVSNICEDAEPDARRIVACVNACRGIGTETLERFDKEHAPEKGFGVHRESKLESERDTYRDLCGELLKALRETHTALCFKQLYSTSLLCGRNKSAITKAEAVMGENSNG